MIRTQDFTGYHTRIMDIARREGWLIIKAKVYQKRNKAVPADPFTRVWYVLK